MNRRETFRNLCGLVCLPFILVNVRMPKVKINRKLPKFKIGDIVYKEDFGSDKRLTYEIVAIRKETLEVFQKNKSTILIVSYLYDLCYSAGKFDILPCPEQYLKLV